MFKKLWWRRYERLEAKNRKLGMEIAYWLRTYDDRSEEEQAELSILLDQLYRERNIVRDKIEKLLRRK